ncbi:Transmembrane secretion effector [Nocardioides alpinus]|uniref:Multidrug efflux pump Tap n=1 Tax=Nocardioides alpinus TaxID=748909 RepID=A0A1I0WH65_9ACTN|nr:MFS transporter [Nocardioides alpinus]PKH37912.1 MFS transporter [Nocardioides alpinus]SFA87737.1 Transmembrane secretion effector [Nocardioides alpinus]
MTRRTPVVGGLVAEGISFLGTRISMIAIPWFVLSTTGSATQTGLVAAAEITPLVLFKALGGPLLDRVGPRRVTLACDLLSALVVASIPLLHGLGMLGFPTLLVLVAVAGALRGPGDAGKAAMTPEIARVAGWSLERVSGLASAVERTSTMGGAALAGLLVATVGATNALYVDAASFLLSFLVFAVATTGLGRPVPAAVGAGSTSYVVELRQGWEFLRTEPVLIAICAMVAVTNLVDQAYSAVLAPVWAKESGAGVAVLGSLFAVMSGASVIGALTAARWGETLPRFRTYVIAFLVCGAPRFVVMALESPIWAVFAVTAVAGVASGFLNPILGAVILERIPAPLLGRVSSLNTAICWSLMPLGGVLGGLAVAGLGLSPALLIAGAAYFVTTMAPTRVPSFRQMDRAPATDTRTMVSPSVHPPA